MEYVIAMGIIFISGFSYAIFDFIYHISSEKSAH